MSDSKITYNNVAYMLDLEELTQLWCPISLMYCGEQARVLRREPTRFLLPCPLERYAGEEVQRKKSGQLMGERDIITMTELFRNCLHDGPRET